MAGASNQEPVIAARSLNFSYGAGELRKQILFDLNMQVRPGEIVLLTGPSGSGKTTLLTLIGALRSVREGELSVLGHELRDASASLRVALRRQIGFIFQAHNLLDFLSARQNVELTHQLHHQMPISEFRRRTEHLFEMVGLAERIDYPPSRLSIGQKQRVAVVRALAGHPKLVLADEPTASLDSKTGRDVVEMLSKLAREQGCPILMVTHDSRVLDIADRRVHMEDGRIAEEGAPPLGSERS
jgi:putative ABC transport system ATP-binding protein